MTSVSKVSGLAVTSARLSIQRSVLAQMSRTTLWTHTRPPYSCTFHSYSTLFCTQKLQMLASSVDMICDSPSVRSQRVSSFNYETGYRTETVIARHTCHNLQRFQSPLVLTFVRNELKIGAAVTPALGTFIIL